MSARTRAPAVIPRGWEQLELPCGRSIRKVFPTGLVVIFSIDPEEDGEYRHMSISRKDRYPDWDEMKDCVYGLGLFSPHDDVTMVLPAKSRPDEYVNVHNNCFHWRQLI